jgi:hypothetical protein
MELCHGDAPVGHPTLRIPFRYTLKRFLCHRIGEGVQQRDPSVESRLDRCSAGDRERDLSQDLGRVMVVDFLGGAERGDEEYQPHANRSKYLHDPEILHGVLGGDCRNPQKNRFSN